MAVERRLLMCLMHSPLPATAQSHYTFVRHEHSPSTVTAISIPVLSSHIQSIFCNTQSTSHFSSWFSPSMSRDLDSVFGRACVAFFCPRTAAASRAARARYQ